MAVGQIMMGVGRGSIFGNRRFFGVHNPFDSALGKTRDPYINMRRVISSSNSDDPSLRSAATETLRRKIECGFDPALFANLDRQVTIDALSKAGVIGSGFREFVNISGERKFLAAVTDIINGCSDEELGKLSNSHNSFVFFAVQSAAAPRLRDMMSPSFARYIALSTSKTFLSEIMPEMRMLNMFDRGSQPLLPRQDVLCYGNAEIARVVAILSPSRYEGTLYGLDTRGEILNELTAINPLLAGILRSRIETSPK